jgi:anti-anti-sigma factor
VTSVRPEATSDEQTPAGSALSILHSISPERSVVSVAGPLTFPDAVRLSGVVRQILEQHPPVALLDLTALDSVDATGVAVLVGIGDDLKTAGIQVRVVAADPRIRHRLPYTLGLRRIFASVEDAIENRD